MEAGAGPALHIKSAVSHPDAADLDDGQLPVSERHQAIVGARSREVGVSSKVVGEAITSLLWRLANQRQRPQRCGTSGSAGNLSSGMKVSHCRDGPYAVSFFGQESRRDLV